MKGLAVRLFQPEKGPLKRVGAWIGADGVFCPASRITGPDAISSYCLCRWPSL
jgi:hypothetical protein